MNVKKLINMDSVPVINIIDIKLNLNNCLHFFYYKEADIGTSHRM